MDIIIKERKAYYCNLKVILIFMVIYGHLIETRIEESSLLMWQYRFIYSIHMPLFAFTSGTFLKDKKACLLQCKNALKYYIFLQGLIVCAGRMVGIEEASIFLPFWHLWYLLSLSCWAIICWVLSAVEKYLNLFLKVVIILLSILLGCLAGNSENIGRTFSLSRTIVFMPYVLAGKFIPEKMNLKKHKIITILFGAAAIMLAIWFAPMIPFKALYQADSYSILDVSDGFGMRLLCYFIGFGLGFLLLLLIPHKRFIISKTGNDTLWIYILHAPIAALLRIIPMDMIVFIIIAPVLSILIIWLLYNIFRWKAKLYRIC